MLLFVEAEEVLRAFFILIFSQSGNGYKGVLDANADTGLPRSHRRPFFPLQGHSYEERRGQ